MPDVQIYENPAHMVQRLRTERGQLKAENGNLREMILEVAKALPAIAGAAGEEIAAQMLAALPPAVDARDPNPYGAPQLPAPQEPAQLPAPARPTRALPAAGGSSGPSPAVIGPIPEGFPIDAFPPEFRAQVVQQSGQHAPQQQPAQAQPMPQAAPQQRFGAPRAPAAARPAIDVPQQSYQQPGGPQATVQRNTGITDVISAGRGLGNSNAVVGRLSVNGQPTPGGPAPANRPPTRLAGLQGAIAKAKAKAAGGE